MELEQLFTTLYSEISLVFLSRAVARRAESSSRDSPPRESGGQKPHTTPYIAQLKIVNMITHAIPPRDTLATPLIPCISEYLHVSPAIRVWKTRAL